MCSLRCSLHEVIKGEQTRVALDSRVTQHAQNRVEKYNQDSIKILVFQPFQFKEREKTPRS